MLDVPRVLVQLVGTQHSKGKEAVINCPKMLCTIVVERRKQEAKIDRSCLQRKANKVKTTSLS
jgi:hypothetical protein